MVSCLLLHVLTCSALSRAVALKWVEALQAAGCRVVGTGAAGGEGPAVAGRGSIRLGLRGGAERSNSLELDRQVIPRDIVLASSRRAKVV